MSETLPYGAWRSPITSELIVGEAIGLGEVRVDGGDIYWIEGRPSEGGRNVLVRRAPDGQIADLTPAPFNVRSRVHEYGGGATTVHRRDRRGRPADGAAPGGGRRQRVDLPAAMVARRRVVFRLRPQRLVESLPLRPARRCRRAAALSAGRRIRPGAMEFRPIDLRISVGRSAGLRLYRSRARL